MTDDTFPTDAAEAPMDAQLYQWALTFNESGDVLLLQEADSDDWTLPGGPLPAGERETEYLADQVDDALDVTVRTVMPVAAQPFRFDGGHPYDDPDVGEFDPDADLGFGVAYLCEIVGDRTTTLGEGYVNTGWLPAKAVDEETLPRANQHRALQAAIAWREWLKD
jgi:hypothetical protein